MPRRPNNLRQVGTKVSRPRRWWGSSRLVAGGRSHVDARWRGLLQTVVRTHGRTDGRTGGRAGAWSQAGTPQTDPPTDRRARRTQRGGEGPTSRTLIDRSVVLRLFDVREVNWSSAARPLTIIIVDKVLPLCLRDHRCR